MGDREAWPGAPETKMRVTIAIACLAAAVMSLPVDKTPNDFKAFLPFVSQIVTYTGAIIPTAMSAKYKHSDEFNMLIQTHSSKIDGPQNRLPDPEHTVELMNKMGQKASVFTGYNPVEMMSDLLGKDGMTEVVANITLFESEFPETVNQNATENFMGSLSDHQLELIHSLNQNVLDRISNVMVDPTTGQPTQRW